METTDLSLKIANRNFYFGVLTGTVVKVEKRAETHVHGSTTTHTSSGGTGTIYANFGGGATISTPRSHTSTTTNIGSSITTVTDLWLQDAYGQEFNIIYKQDISLREGHKVSAVGLFEENKDGYKAFIYNHTTKDLKKITQPSEFADWFGLLNKDKGVHWAIIVLMCIGGMIIGAKLLDIVLGVVLAVALLIAALVLNSRIKSKASKHNKEVIDTINAKLNSVIDETIKIN